MAKRFEVPARKLIFLLVGLKETIQLSRVTPSQSAKGSLITTVNTLSFTIATTQRAFGFWSNLYSTRKSSHYCHKSLMPYVTDTILVSVMYANNETANYLPIKVVTCIKSQLPSTSCRSGSRSFYYQRELGARFSLYWCLKFHGLGCRLAIS